MSGQRWKNANWLINNRLDGSIDTGSAQLAVLMDIRDELQKLNRRMDCSETLAIPRILKQIRANTSKRRRKRR